MKRKKVVLAKKFISPGKVQGKIVKINHPVVQKKINRTLKTSIVEGGFSAVSYNAGFSYFSPFAIFMKATNFQVGILNAIINFFPGVAQLFTAKLIEKFRRKKIVLIAIMLQILMFLPIIFSGYLYYIGFSWAVWSLIFFAGLSYLFSGTAYPIWFSWMGSLIPGDIRGKYFAKKRRVYNIFSILSLVLAALMLDYFKGIGYISKNVELYTLIGFSILFGVAMLFRTLSWILLSSQYEPRIIVRKKDYFSFWQLIKNSQKNSFGKFLTYRFLFSIAIAIASPFWAVYLLGNLGYSYLWYIMIVSSGIFFQMMFLPIWGKLADKFGNVSVIKMCSIFGIFAPLFYVVSIVINNSLFLKLFLLILPGIAGGIAWGGYMIATESYLLDSVRQSKRSFATTYMNLAVGLGAFVGAAIGSVLVLFEVGFMNIILFIFLVSFIARLLVVLFGFRLLEEVRPVEKFKSEYFFREIHPVAGVYNQVHHVGDFVKGVEHYV